jgi:hypothetical protein
MSQLGSQKDGKANFVPAMNRVRKFSFGVIKKFSVIPIRKTDYVPVSLDTLRQCPAGLPDSIFPNQKSQFR